MTTPDTAVCTPTLEEIADTFRKTECKVMARLRMSVVAVFQFAISSWHNWIER